MTKAELILKDIENGIEYDEIAQKHDVSKSYITQIKHKNKERTYLKFMWTIMNDKMQWRLKPTEAEKMIIKEIRDLIRG